MIDPRMADSASEYNNGPWDSGMSNGYGTPGNYGAPGYGMPESYGAPGGMPGADPWGGGEGMEERMLARRAERMYQALAMQGKYSQIDKAKHSKQYRNYLLENFDENEMDGFYG